MKNKTIIFVLASLLFFSFATYSHAITITGSETVTTNSNATYTATGCSGTVSWGVTGTGASISSNGVLTTGPASCGAITVAASCSDGNIATQDVRVTNAGNWFPISPYRCTEYNCSCANPPDRAVAVYKGRYTYHVTWQCVQEQCLTGNDCNCGGCTYSDPGYDCPCGTPPASLAKEVYTAEWKCQCSDSDHDGYSSCVNDCDDRNSAIKPGVTEICGDLKDNNCNGQVDEGCECIDGQTQSCPYSGPPNTENVGECKAGTQTCTNGQWGECQGEVLPAAEEICGDLIDNNCDGQTDEGCTVCQDIDGDGHYTISASCPQGDDCNDNDASIYPGVSEKCNTIDDNCNGQVDETCVGQTCSSSEMGSSASLSSGNLYHDQTLFQTATSGFTLSYNSIDTYNGSLGKGWTHNYNLLLFSNPDSSIGLKQGDGNVIYFRLSNGIYYPEAQSGDTSYITVNNDNTFTQTLKSSTTYNFNPSGRLTSIKDRNNNTTTLTYTGDNLTTITDPSGRTIYLTYDSQNKITSITDPSNNIYSLTYINNMLTQISTPNSQLGTLNWQYTYNQNSQMLTKTDPKGYVTTYTYDANNKVISSIDPEGKTKAITYDQINQTATATEKDGGIWTYKYDPLLNVTTSKTDPQGNKTTYTYDQYKNLISSKEPDGSTTRYTYDEYGNMTSVTDPTGNTTAYTYNEYGQVTSVTDSEGNATRYEYDSNGNQTGVIDPTGAKTQYQYDSKGNVISVTNANGQTTALVYDQYNNLISVTDSAGATTRFSFDISGNMTSQTDPTGSITRFEYNSLNQLVKITDSQGNITTYTYDANGNRTSIADGNGKTTYYEYNYKGQLIKVTDALGNTTTYTYGGTGCPSCGGGGDKLTAITDANGQTTMYLYDSLGRLIKETDSLGNAITYTYDSRGNLISKTDANTINYTYDTLGRLTKKTYPDSSFEVFEYNSKGNITSTGNKDMAYQLSSDSNGRLIASTDSNGLTVRYEYDAMGNRTKMITPDGQVINYKYDANNRLTEIVIASAVPVGRQEAWQSQVFGFMYDSLGRRTKLTLPNGTYTTYSYDTNSRLTNLMHKTSSGAIINSFAYTHDNVGNRISKAEINKKTTYTYDQLYRLTEALPTKLQGKDKTQINKAESFTYDPVGNRLIGPETKEFYSYNQGNQLTADRKSQYEYDSNGNLISKTGIDDDNKAKTWAYSYDYENRLVKVVKQGDDETVIVSFKYDPFGRRIEKKVEEQEHGKTEETKTYNYVYDNEDIILEYPTKAEGNETKAEITRYIHGLGIDEPLAIEQKGNVYYYHADGLGSIIALTDNRGKVVQSYSYDSFGGMKQSGDKVKQPYTYTAREWDEEIKLYFNRARYRDPYAGIFITKDPMLHPANGPPANKACTQAISSPSFESIKRNPQKLNSYLYTANNPQNVTDPFGLFGTTDCSYYKQRCKDTGEFYYCFSVRVACNIIHIPFTNWDQCVRQCLQEYDFYNKTCSVKSTSFSLKDFKESHAFCFEKCWDNTNEDPISRP